MMARKKSKGNKVRGSGRRKQNGRFAKKKGKS